ncbi:MAG: hypothetical protein IKT34_00615 [Clostridia bacterium]|nr:hypothetical protein [Clostridia bacterium]
MKITYLGTAAAEGWPALFCNCEYCKNAKRLGGKNIRTRSQALINDDLLIDFPADSYMHMLKTKYDMSGVKHCFVTHSHIDHFEPTDLCLRIESCSAHDMTEPYFHIYGNSKVLSRFDRFVGSLGEEDTPPAVTVQEIDLYQTVYADNYRVTPLKANHAGSENAFVYLVEDGDKTLLYLHDTGLLYDEVYDYLKSNGVRADLISYDCTYGALESAGGHMGLDSVPYVRKRLEEIGVADDKTIHVVNHFSHNGILLHDEMEKAAAEIGFLCAYDGMEIEF